MREIRFRAWDKQNKEMIHWEGMYGIVRADSGVGVHVAIADQCFVMPEDCILMQFTGLHDKNGKEIYEGDIVYHETCSPDDPACGAYGDKMVITFFRGCFGFEEDGSHFCLRQIHSVLEVIGNLYENEDMLDKG